MAGELQGYMTGRDFAHSMIASVGLHQIHHYLSVVRNQTCALGFTFFCQLQHHSAVRDAIHGFQSRLSISNCLRQVDSMPDSLKTAKVSQDGFQTFATLWRNVHSLAVATDLHYNSMGFFRKADFKAHPQPSTFVLLPARSFLSA